MRIGRPLGRAGVTGVDAAEVVADVDGQVLVGGQAEELTRQLAELGRRAQPGRDAVRLLMGKRGQHSFARGHEPFI